MIQYLYTLLFIAYLSSFPSFGQMSLVVVENFDNNRRLWLQANNEDDQLIIKQGKLVWEKSSNTPKFIWKRFNINLNEDFHIITSLQTNNVSESGIVWGGRDANNTKCFTILKDSFQISELIDKKWVIQQKFKKLKQFSGLSIYNLEIKRIKNYFYYYVNQENVFKELVPEQITLGNRLGFVSFGQSSIEIDSLWVLANQSEINFSKKFEFSQIPFLPKNINTTVDELAPVISANDSVLYFSRRDDLQNIGSSKDDIYYSELVNDNQWTVPKNMARPINNENYNHVCSYDGTNKALILANTYFSEADTLMTAGVSISYLMNNQWSNPVPIYIKDFYSTNSKNDFSLSSNGKLMLMALERKEGLGKNDLYVSFKNNELWTKPLHLGNIINTEEDDFSPFLAEDLKTLFFSSRGHMGLGEADIFMCERLDDSWQKWSKPVNLGSPINSEYFEGYFNFAKGSDKAYFISETDQKHDIFAVKLPKKLVEDIANNSIKSTDNKIDKKNLLHEIIVNKILFIRGGVEVSKNSYQELDKLYSKLVEHPLMEIEIRGHTDNQGDSLSNILLSKARAEFIKKYLVDKGIKEQRIIATGKGGCCPIASNKIESSRKLNRRVEIIVLKE